MRGDGRRRNDAIGRGSPGVAAAAVNRTFSLYTVDERFNSRRCGLTVNSVRLTALDGRLTED
jgi:hypothetical protein